MDRLSTVFVFKIAATVLFWCVPLILFPATALEALGLPPQSSYMFVRLLGWDGLTGTWSTWGGIPRFVLWSSLLATAAITAGLHFFGVRPASGAPASKVQG